MHSDTVSYPKNRNSLQNWKVLVVDDQRDNLDLAAAILRTRGAEVVVVDNGPDALSILDDFDATVILLDLAMPEMDGWEMIKAIRENKHTSHIPVIAFSVRLSMSDSQKAKAAGFNGYISKPFTIPQLVDQILEIVNNGNQ
jgi:CheY-like chemotaxis protein